MPKLQRGQQEINLDGQTTQLGAGAGAQIRRQSQASFSIAGTVGRTASAVGRVGSAFAPFWARVQRSVDQVAIEDEEARLADTPSARGLVEINAPYTDQKGNQQKIVIRDENGILPPELPDKRPWFGVQNKAFYDLQVSKYATEAIADSERHILGIAQDNPVNPENFSMKAAAYRGAMVAKVHPSVRGAVDSAIQEASQGHYNRISNARHTQERESFKAQWATEHQRKVGDIGNYVAANGWAHEPVFDEKGNPTSRLVPEVGALIKKVTDHIQIGVNAGIITQSDSKGIIEDMGRQVANQSVYGALKQFGVGKAGIAGMEAVIGQVVEGKFLVPRLHYNEGKAAVSFATYDSIYPDPGDRVILGDKLRKMWVGATEAQRAWKKHDEQVKDESFSSAMVDSLLAAAEGRAMPNLRALAERHATDPVDHAAKLRTAMRVEQITRTQTNQFTSRLVSNLRAEGLRERYFQTLEQVGRDGMGYYGTEYFTEAIAGLDESDLGQALQLFSDAVQHGESILRAQVRAQKQLGPVIDRQMAFTENRYVGPSKPTTRAYAEPRYAEAAARAGLDYQWETMPTEVGQYLITSPLGSTLPESLFTFMSGAIGMSDKREAGMEELTRAVQYFRTIRDDPQLEPQLSALDEKSFAALSYLQKYGLVLGNVADPDLIKRAGEIQRGETKGARYGELSRDERDELWKEINDTLDSHKHAPKRLKTAIAEIATMKLGITDNDAGDAVSLAWNEVQRAGHFGVSSLAVDPVSQQHLNQKATSYLAPWAPDVVYGNFISAEEITEYANAAMLHATNANPGDYALGVNAHTQYGRVDPETGHLIYHVRVADRLIDGSFKSRVLRDASGPIELHVGTWAEEAVNRNTDIDKMMGLRELQFHETRMRLLREGKGFQTRMLPEHRAAMTQPTLPPGFLGGAGQRGWREALRRSFYTPTAPSE